MTFVTTLLLLNISRNFFNIILISALEKEDMDSYKLIITLGRIFSYIPLTLERERITYQIVYSLTSSVLVFTHLFFFMQSYDVFLLISIFLKRLIFLKLMFQAINFNNVWNEWNDLLVTTIEQFEKIMNESVKLSSSALWSLAACIIFIDSHQIYLCYRGEDLWYNFVFLEYLDLFSTYLPTSFVLILKRGFEVLNKHSSGVEGKKRAVRKTRHEVQYFMELYKNLYKLTMCFNKLFGWVILFWLANMLASSCFLMQFVVTMTLQGEFNMVHMMNLCIKIAFHGVS